MKRVLYLDPAKAEMIEAARYYEGCSPGLGNDFLDEIEKGIQHIQEQPFAAPVLQGGIRRRLLSRFPFGILYADKPDQVIVVAVMHLKRRPGYWVGRIDS